MNLDARVIAVTALMTLGCSVIHAEEPQRPALCYEMTMEPIPYREYNAAVAQASREYREAMERGEFVERREVPTHREIPTLKAVKVHVTQTQETDTSPIKLDASSSTVPSGKMEFQWNNKYDAAHTKPVLMHEDGDPGDHWQLKVRVLDVVCHTSELKIVPVRSR